jgi:phage repressor protein C with HTH and peptisase S24 domain
MTGQEFKKLLTLNDLSQEQAAQVFGVSRQTINTWCKVELLSKEIVDKVNTLLKVKTFSTENSTLKVTPYKTIIDESKEVNVGVPVYDLDVTAGTDLEYSSNGLPEKIKGYISLPNFKNCVAFIMVRGDSMYPKFKAGDLIGVEPVKDLDIIQWGHAYVVVTHDNQRMLKYIRKGKNESTIILRSEDDKYDDIIIEKRKIIKLYMAKGPVRDDWQ